MNKEVMQEAAPKAASPKKITANKARFIRQFLNSVITETILLRRFGYRYLEEVPESIYPDVKKSLFSLHYRLSRDRKAWESKIKYVYRRKPVYENNKRIF